MSFVDIFLETERLVIRPPSLADFEGWRIVQAESGMQQQPEETIRQWLEYHILEFEKYGFGMGSAFLKENNEFIGRAGLFHYPGEANPDLEMGYVILKKHWNRGYASELARGLIDMGFAQLKQTKIIALTSPDNKASQRVLEKVGMRQVKTVQSEGEDFLLYEISKP